MLIVLLIFVLLYSGTFSGAFWRFVEQRPKATFSDPHAYCRNIGNIDAPGEAFVGPKVPESVARGLRSALQAPPSAPLEVFVENSFWRCMDGKVYACTVGANLACLTRADTSLDPAEAVREYCKSHPEVPAIPMVATGRATVYAWRCANGKPVIVRESVKPDARGFLSNIWYEIPPQLDDSVGENIQ